MRAPRLRDHRPFVLFSRSVSPYASHEIALMTSGRRWQGSIEHSSSRSTPCPRIAKSPISDPPPPGVVPGWEAELACREQAQDIRFAADAAYRRRRRRRRLVAARRDRHNDDRKVSDAAGHATSRARSGAILLRPFTGDLAYSVAAWTSKKPAPETSTSTPGILAISRLIFYI